MDKRMEKFVKNTFQVRVVRTGTITLRKKLRVQNKLEEGDMLTLIDQGNGVVSMDSQNPLVEEIANKLAKEWQDQGESLESKLVAMRKIRVKLDTSQA